MNRFDVLGAAVQAVDPEGSIRIDTLDNPGWTVSIHSSGMPAIGSASDEAAPLWRWGHDENGHPVASGPADALDAMLRRLAEALGAASDTQDLLVDQLTAWYLDQCDGDWEHTYGATISRRQDAWAVELRSDVWLDETAIESLLATGATVGQTTWHDGASDRWEWTLSLGGRAPWGAMAAVLKVLRTVNAEGAPARGDVLARLVAFEGGIAALRHAVRALPWDADAPLVTLAAWQVESVLRRAASGELDADEVEQWANLVEMREDIHFDPAAAAAIFDLANPDTQGEITPARIAELLATLATA